MKYQTELKLSSSSVDWPYMSQPTQATAHICLGIFSSLCSVKLGSLNHVQFAKYRPYIGKGKKLSESVKNIEQVEMYSSKTCESLNALAELYMYSA